MDNRLNQLEAAMEENKGYLSRILKLMTKEAEDLQDTSPIPTLQTQSKARAIAIGKQPLQVTVIDEYEKYSFQPMEPGILAQKPSLSSPPIQPPAPKQPFLELPIVDSLQEKRGEYLMSKENDKNHKLEVATMYLQGKAEVWFDGYMMHKHRATWHEFVVDLCHRFFDKEFSDVIEEFNKLFQQTTFDDYQTKFEELKPFMLQHNSHLEETYFVSSLISGLKDEIKHRVKVHEPTSLTDAYRKARLYELALEVEGRKPKTSYIYTSPNFTNSNPKPQFPPNPIPFKPPQTTPKQTLMEYRKTNIMCFKCGDKFGPAHQSKPKQLNLMEEEEMPQDIDQQLQVQAFTSEPEPFQQDSLDVNLEISLNALNGNIGCSTLRIQGTIQGKPMSILVDSGSTHSFFTTLWAKEGQELMHNHPLTITVANGEKLFSTSKCNNLCWKMQGYVFQHDFRVLSMGGYDMVLGVDWMKRYSPMVMDFNAMTLSFTRGTESITLHGAMVLDKRIIKRNNRPVTQLLIQWTNLGTRNSTWEDYTVLRSQFPDFDRWGQASTTGGGIVTNMGMMEACQMKGKKNENELGIFSMELGKIETEVKLHVFTKQARVNELMDPIARKAH
ncbi:hypothetical protein GQ457_06G016560 [Hibiscus cannabinus]